MDPACSQAFQFFPKVFCELGSGVLVGFLSHQAIHLFVAVKMSKNSMGLLSGLIRIQLFLSVQNSSFCCLILKIGVPYHIFLMYYLEHTGLLCKQFYRLLHVVILLVI